MSFSIIIISYNTKKLLINCLNSIFNNFKNNPCEIIIVDNASNDGSAEFIKSSYPSVLLVENKENNGFGAANNRGAKIAQGDILFFLNPDTLIQDDVFQKIVEVFAADPGVAIAAPQLVLADGSAQSWAYGWDRGIWEALTNKFKNREPSHQLNNSALKVDWVSGAALIIRREIFEKIGGFDEKFFMYFEDRDLCERVRKIGYRVVVLPGKKVIHLGGKSLNESQKRKGLYYQSQNYYWQKKYGFFVSLALRLVRWPYKFYILKILCG